MSSYTASGARRTGDEYQDLQSAEVLIEWLENPVAYRWVRLEAMDGSLDDIQAERADGRQRLLQVKFGTNATVEWDWNELLEQEKGKKGPKPSLLMKWKSSLDKIVVSGVIVSEVALLTNRSASAAIRAHLSDAGIVDFTQLSPALQASISAQLGGPAAASTFFASFHFFFGKPSLESLDASLRRRFQQLGGSQEGWSSLLGRIRRWINRQDEPPPDGTITLHDVRAAALWHLPPQIPQGFLVPQDYVPPETWSNSAVKPQLQASGNQLVVVTGRPGVGKSTYLSWLSEQLRSAGVPVVRHHYFLSITDATARRTEWETAADAIIGQLRYVYPGLVQGVDDRNPLPEKVREFLVAGGRERRGKEPLIVIVDGLDHVWRDTGSEEGLRRLFDLLLPAPDGVVIIVGTQDIDVARIPRKLRDLCPRERWLEVPVLDGKGVHAWLQHHRLELGLPTDEDHANSVLGELTHAFREVSGGHPLVLHYTLSASRQRSSSIRPEQVRALPSLDPSSSIATYYQALWETINPEGHHLLHLLAGFPWVWPADGLVQCLAPHADRVQLEQAERAIRHVLGQSPVGVTAFHESLLAFTRALPDHQSAARSLRPRVIDWLTHLAPEYEYWRWRHEWEERAKNGDPEPLIASATLDFCIGSLVAGRGRREVAKIVAASGWAALESGRLGIATERHYIDAYLEEARTAAGVFSQLAWLALHNFTPRRRELELELFLLRKSQATEEELEAAAEVAFAAEHDGICNDLFDEIADRWNSMIFSPNRMGDRASSLQMIMPSLMAAHLTIPSKGSYQRHMTEHGTVPAYCPHELYAKALARLCNIGDKTAAQREELRFLANHKDWVSFEAVDEIVRLACKDGFDPNSWLTSSDARRSGLFRCYQLWVRQVKEPLADAPRDVSFVPVWQERFGRNQNIFLELARSYFFSCLASAAEGGDPAQAVGVDAQAFEVAMFLSLLRDLAREAAAAKQAGLAVGGAWLIHRLLTIDPPEIAANDFQNDLARRANVSRVVVAIAQDLEELHQAETHEASLKYEVILSAIQSDWTWARVWIEDRVDRRLRMGDSQAARLLIDRERLRLERSRDYLHTRAAEYVSLAQFCHLHEMPPHEARELARLAARNLLGHGFHKDGILFDLLAAIRVVAGPDKGASLARLQSLSPVIQVIDKITDRDETRHLMGELGEIVWDLAPEALPSYLRALQRKQLDWVVESCYTGLAETGPLDSVYDKALAATIVHEGALTALEERAGNGDLNARTVLASTLAYCGRRAADPKEADTGSSNPTNETEKKLPLVEDYPPARLIEFMRAVRDAHSFGDEHLAAWTHHWRSVDPGGLLAALTAYRAANNSPHERLTGKVIVELALEHAGRKATWEWLVAYHEAVYGWNWHLYELSDVEWIWAFVRSQFKTRWLEFITATSRPRWGTAGGAPAWSIERMVRFLSLLGETSLANEVLDAAVHWGAGLAANMRLPEPALAPESPAIPVALRLLVDRLDCPSRMVQERATWSLAGLLAEDETCDETSRALLVWHAAEPLELRSCMLLLVLLLAKIGKSASSGACLGIARQSNLVPSVGADLLLREFGVDGVALAASLNYRSQHSGKPTADFSAIEGFDATVGAHLAPIFCRWATELDSAGVSFSRQWEWETVQLAKKLGLSLRPDAHFPHHYRGVVNKPSLSINDRLSTVLRSAYLRALHYFLEEGTLDNDRVQIHARRVAVMADPVFWTVRPSECPTWWPVGPTNPDGELDGLFEAIGKAVNDRLANRDPNEGEILAFAAGPIGNQPRFRATLFIRAFLQAAYGPSKPPSEDLVEIPWIACQAIPPRLSLPGTYARLGRSTGCVGDWLMAPLAWMLRSDTAAWLLPDRHGRGIYVPPTWLFSDSPRISSESDHIRITLGDQVVARYRYWYDDLRERNYVGADSRAGCELLIRRESLEAQIKEGASLCWVVTLSISQRGDYKEPFGEPHKVRAWVIGGSRMAWPLPWQPPSPDSLSASALTVVDDGSDEFDGEQD